MDIKYAVYGLTLIPLLAFLFALTRMMTAKRLSEGMTVKRREAETQTRNKFITAVGFIFACVMYGIVETMMVYNGNGGFTAPENMKYVCVIAFMCNALTCILQGFIGESQINKGALTDEKAFARMLLYFGLAEIIAVVGVIYFFLGFAGVV